jgi:hypothetical protein
LWGEGGVGIESPALLEPFIVELTSDNFMTRFLSIMSGQDGTLPSDIGSMAPAVTAIDDTGDYRLFQPLSQRYYLVTASLVCRRAGIPDRAVAAAKGERTNFVVRRIDHVQGEQGWVPQESATPGDPPTGKWVTAAPGLLVAGEEQLPMHPVPVAAFAAAGSTAATFGMTEAGRRTVHYGYVATGRRERIVPVVADPVSALQNVLEADPALGTLQNVVLGDLMSRVIGPWGSLLPTAPSPPPTPPASDPDYSSLYVLLDLADWLKTYLPQVYSALIANSPSGLDTHAAALFKVLAGIQVETRPPPPTQPPPAKWVPSTTLTKKPLGTVLSDLQQFAALLSGQPIGAPQTGYDLTDTTVPSGFFDASSSTGSLANLSLAALHEANAVPIVPPELQAMIKADPPVPVPGYRVDTYVIRTVFEHDPCAPVLSAPSHTFQMARTMDGDAPARKIRLAMPEVSNLRQFKRGVAIEMPPSLRRVVDRVNPKMLQGGGLGEDPGVEIGMICSFSIQVMWVLSFLVMFIFVISFNFIFWWIAFIKICFPVPMPRSSPDNPAP